LQWTCERCGLQRDDRRGSNCNDVKGQAHEWIETYVYEKRQREEKIRNWINSDDSSEWKKEYENIKKYFKEETDKIQQKYTPLFEKNKKKYKMIFEEANKKYKIITEYYKKLFENKEIIIKEARKKYGKKCLLRILIILAIMLISFITIKIITNIILSILAAIIILIFGKKIGFNESFCQDKYLNQILFTFKENYFNSYNDKEKQEILDFLNELKNIYLHTENKYELVSFFKTKDKLEEEIEELKENGKEYLTEYIDEKYIPRFKKIKEDYEKDIEDLLENGINMMKESNEKHNVNANYSYDDFYFDFSEIRAYTIIGTNHFRKKFIGDNDFFENYKKLESKGAITWKD